jgi:aminopeptidase N
MLREIIGEEAFGDGLRDFFEARRFKPARTTHFIEAMERASGRGLSAFFRGWFDSHLLPEVQVRHEVVTTEAGHLLKIRVRQPREIFVFPLVVSWRENGATVRKTLLVDAAAKDFEFSTAVRPLKFKANPDKSVPGRFDD